MAAFLSLWLCACGAMGRLAGQPEAEATPPVKTDVCYAAQEGLPLYPGPAVSDSPAARLPLNEKLLRSKIERGMAHVTVPRTGQTGWVDNSKLKRKKTAQSVPAASAPAVVPPQEKEAPAPVETGDEARSKAKPDASIFDVN